MQEEYVQTKTIEHVDVQFFQYVRQLVGRGQHTVSHVETYINTSDILTKALPTDAS